MEIRPADRCGRNRPRETLGTMASAKWLWSGWQIQLSRSGRQNKGGSLWTQKRLAERMLRGGGISWQLRFSLLGDPPRPRLCDVMFSAFIMKRPKAKATDFADTATFASTSMAFSLPFIWMTTSGWVVWHTLFLYHQTWGSSLIFGLF